MKHYTLFFCRYQHIMGLLFCLMVCNAHATNYTVATKTDLVNRMTAAIPGDTVFIASGTYNNWGAINFSNTSGSATSAWIVLTSKGFGSVVFTGSVYFQFRGTRVQLNGFVFNNGNAGTNAVISFRSSSSNLANYCRVSNMLIDNFNTYSADSSTANEWVGIYGTHNRVDHCTFINKYNERATVVVWYSTIAYPSPAISTFHQIDSNYFNGRTYLADNGGETIRVGDSNSSRTDGYNTIEYNLFENCTQTEPEIISNKSDFNIYRYNTFKNNDGGLTLRHGRYCSVYGNFFIVDDAARTKSYGIRVIDKGHRVFNNYLEGLIGNKNSLTNFRIPIGLWNGASSTNDTTDASKAAGYFPADSSIVAFNTIVNCSGGSGITLGYTNSGANLFQPKGIRVANNLIKMTLGQALYNDASNTQLTYSAEGNIYQAPSGVGLASSSGFTPATLTFGSRIFGILPPPGLVQDAATNTIDYNTLLAGLDAQGQLRSSTYDVGADEQNGTGAILASPLDSNVVGAGKPISVPLPVRLLGFYGTLVNAMANLIWTVAQETNLLQYELEYSSNGNVFSNVGMVKAMGFSAYHFKHLQVVAPQNYYRLKLVDNNGSFRYSNTILLRSNGSASFGFFPNPAKNFIQVAINNFRPGMLFTITDAKGMLVTKTTVASSNQKIFVGEFASGLYHLQIADAKAILSNYPFIISK